MKPSYLILRMTLPFCLFFSHISLSYSFTPPTAIGSISKGLGNINVCKTSAWSAYNQSTEMISDSSWHFGMFVANPYLLSAYKSYAVSSIYSTKDYALGVCLYQVGYSVHNRLTCTVSYALILNKKFSMGTSLHLLQTRITGRNIANQPLIVLDAKVEVTSKNTCFIKLFNPIKNPIDSSLSSQYSATLQHSITAKSQLYVQADVTSQNDVSFKFGMSHQTNKLLNILIGTSTNPYSVSFGIGISLKNKTLHVANNYHSSLGFSPSISTEYCRP